MGAVGDLLVRRLESELAEARNELARLKNADASPRTPSVVAVAAPIALPNPAPVPPLPLLLQSPPLVKQPALWFAVAGWAVAVMLLFRRRSI